MYISVSYIGQFNNILYKVNDYYILHIFSSSGQLYEGNNVKNNIIYLQVDTTTFWKPNALASITVILFTYAKSYYQIEGYFST